MKKQPKTLAVAYLKNDERAKENATSLSDAMDIPLIEIALDESGADALSPLFSRAWNNWKELTGYEECLAPETADALKSLKGIDLIHVVKGEFNENQGALDAFTAAASRLGIAVA